MALPRNARQVTLYVRDEKVYRAVQRKAAREGKAVSTLLDEWMRAYLAGTPVEYTPEDPPLYLG